MMKSLPDYSNPPFADYESPELSPGLLSRVIPTPCFYTRVARIVFLSSYRAWRRNFDGRDWWVASAAVRKAFERTGARLSVKGTEHFVRLGKPCVFIGNHMSTAETFLLGSMILPVMPMTFVVKNSLVEYPIFKHVIRSLDPVVVGRTNPREDLKAVLGGGKERLEKGISIVIFPQRTRTVQFDRESFNTIGVKLAKRTGVPVIPLALKTDAWSNGRILKDYGRFNPELNVQFEFGEPVDAARDDRAAHLAVVEFIEDRLRSWGL